MRKNPSGTPKYDPVLLLNNVDTARPLPSGIELAIWRAVERETLKKGEMLLQIGAVCDRVWLIEKGLFRSYKMVKGQEQNAWFMKENDFMTDPKSFRRAEPSNHAIQALEDCIVHSISRRQMEAFCGKSHEFEHICHLLTWNYYMRFMDYWDELTSGTVQQRYRRFLQLFPGLDSRKSMALRHIASLLKCSTRSVQRVRSDEG
jgi:CRP-like cAMP-binding protein